MNESKQLDVSLGVKKAAVNSFFLAGQKMKPVAKKLDVTGKIKSHCAIVNSEEELAKLKSRQQMSNSIDQVNELKRKQKEVKIQQAKDDLHSLAPKAKEKLAKKQLVDKLTKAEIVSVLAAFFNRDANVKLPKGTLVIELENQMAAKPDVLGIQLKPKAPPVAAMAATEPTDEDAALLEAMTVPDNGASTDKTAPI